MNDKLTGSEPISTNSWLNPTTGNVEDYNYTLRQHAQLEFMKALVTNGGMYISKEDETYYQRVSERAEKFTNAYIQSLNE